MNAQHEVLVLGAGPCGLAIARQLQHKFGVRVLVIERSVAPAASWRSRYEGFRLNTTGYWSHLPGQRIGFRHGRWPSKDSMVQYYDSYVARQGIDVELGTEVISIDRPAAGEGWVVETDRGKYEAAAVVVALGNYRVPIPPPWPGVTSFRGSVVHSANYRNPWPFKDEEVLVVGVGNSGSDIAVQLASGVAKRVLLSIRTPPHLVKRSTAGIPADAFALLTAHAPPRMIDSSAAGMRRVTFGDLSSYGFTQPPAGIFTTVRDTGRIPTLADALVKEVKAGRVEVVAAVESIEGGDVRLADGTTITPNSIVAANGFAPGLEGIAGHLGVLGDGGHPTANGIEPADAGLWFAGYAEPFTGPLRSFRRQATPIARAIQQHLAARS